jgi:hypothetical protein
MSFEFCLDDCTNQLKTLIGSAALFTGSTPDPVFTAGNYPTTSTGFEAFGYVGEEVAHE